jgi:hypothetical protein
VLPEVIWMSEASAEAYEPGDREVCISIRDPAAPLPALGRQFLAVLSLEFDDDPEPGWEERRRSITEAQAELVVEGVVEADAATGAWVARLDWNAIRHEALVGGGDASAALNGPGHGYGPRRPSVV